MLKKNSTAGQSGKPKAFPDLRIDHSAVIDKPFVNTYLSVNTFFMTELVSRSLLPKFGKEHFEKFYF